MILLLALVLAFLLFPWPWNFVVIVAAAVCETSIVVIGMWYTRRGRSQVGAQALIGGTAEVITTLAPAGQVKLRGEIWQAHSEEGAQIGETVRIRTVEGLTLQVDRYGLEPPVGLTHHPEGVHIDFGKPHPSRMLKMLPGVPSALATFPGAVAGTISKQWSRTARPMRNLEP